MMSWEGSRFQLPTFPVPQYHYFSMAGVTYAQIPPPQPGEKAPEEQKPDMSDGQAEKYFYFSDPMITRSNAFMPEHPSHGLAKSRSKGLCSAPALASS
mmetsp:Transcript_34112/g.76552  ORF Transcript_34112/g.76552 Transcript_34112/m.76552 type:complete len:98 (+) Transcript_34112:3-296(+)